jgi:hypothetical protein
MMASFLSCLKMVLPKMMSKFQMAMLVTRLPSCSLMKARTSVSAFYHYALLPACLTFNSDVIVLTAMGEETAIDCKEAPAK